MGFIPSPSCSLADPELGAGHPKPGCLLNDPCLGLAWPEIPQGKEETQKPHSLSALPHPGGVAQAGDATSRAGSGGGMGNGRQGHRWRHCVGGAAGEHQLPGGLRGELWRQNPAWVGDQRESRAGQRLCLWLLLLGGRRGEGKKPGSVPAQRSLSHPNFWLLSFYLCGYQSCSCYDYGVGCIVLKLTP